MKKHELSYFKELANKIMIDLSEDELISLQKDFDEMLHQLEILNQIDTTNCAEMVYPFEEETTYLRDDETYEVLDQEEVLLNASLSKDGQIVVPKVVG